MQEVQVNYNVSDNCPGVTTNLSVTSNEPEYGNGNGDTGPDWEVVNDHKVKLRSERWGMAVTGCTPLPLRPLMLPGTLQPPPLRLLYRTINQGPG